MGLGGIQTVADINAAAPTWFQTSTAEGVARGRSTIYSSESKPENAATQLASLQRRQDALWVDFAARTTGASHMLSQFSENRSANSAVVEI